jgi:magnesium chelatase family protein
MLVKTFGSAVYGVDAHIITVEGNVAAGGVNFYMVGLPDNAVKESQMRIHAALKNIGYKIPGKTATIYMS